MPEQEFFPLRPEITPMVYAYEELNPNLKGLLKVGYTSIDVEQRVAQQYPTKRPDGIKPYQIVWQDSAMYSDGGTFTDHDLHRCLQKRGFPSQGGEWYSCSVAELQAAYIAVRDKTENLENRNQSFKMRPEQIEAVQKTYDAFKSVEKEGRSSPAKFLWNAKMRFGKTFAAYQLAKKMDLKKILVLTFKPAVQSAWEDDLLSHVDFEGWQFVGAKTGFDYDSTDKSRPIVCFGSFQDLLGTNDNGGIKVKNEWIHTTNWDLVIFDEYHFGAWRDNAKKLFEYEEEELVDFDPESYQEKEAGNAINESFLPITSPRYLYLSGTPFRAINSGEFIEDQIYNWTYSDEQNAKENWGDFPDNPYAALPRMVLMTYKIPDSISQIAKDGEFDEFDLNLFFSAEGKGDKAKFKYEDYVQKWLDLIRGAYLGTSTDDLKLGGKKPDMPFSSSRLLSILTHTLWFLPNVASCYAMANLLKKRNNSFFDDYKVNVSAGSQAGIGVSALTPVIRSMGDPLKTKTITLTCGKLTTGVTVKPWTGIFMLRNLKSPETYFQAAFRVQSPWEVDQDNNHKVIMKNECYVFDFALDRALRQISDYSSGLNIGESNPEKKVAEFINFLPVLAYDGSTMKRLEASDILDIAFSGTSATLLARRWESALLVNVDNDTLQRLIDNEAAMNALMSIEGFRSLNQDINEIIIASNKVKAAKSRSDKLSPAEKKEISDEEKEYKSKRKLIQEKLIKFATRIPIFMYLSDFREYSLKDVITQLEPGLFKRVTGLDVKDFELLCSLGVFNDSLMNDAVYKFKRYEDASLSYTGIDKHEGEAVGGFDTVLTREEFDSLFGTQQKSLKAEQSSFDDPSELPDLDEDDSSEDEDYIEELPKPKKQKAKNTSSVKTEAKLEVGKTAVKHYQPWIRKEPDTQTVFKEKEETVAKTVTPEKIKVDLSDLKIGSKVKHKLFGEGEVVGTGKDMIEVTFEVGRKKFEIPQAFELGFLTKG